MDKIKPYRKAAVAVVGFAAVVAMQMFAPDTWEWRLADGVLAALAAFGVYAVRNKAVRNKPAE